MANNILHSSTSDSESKNTSTDSTLFNEKFPFQLRQDFASRITEDESDFFKWKKTNCYDETLCVTFIKKRYGDKSIILKKIVGCYPNVEEEYKSIKWFNF